MYHNRLLSALLIVSVALCLCNGATLYPRSLTTQTGSVSNTPLSALQTKDQSGSQDTWSKYVEFYGSSTAYKGIFTFDVSSITTSVASYALNLNFKGPRYSDQVWQLEYFVPSSETWILAGDNTNAASWSWSSLSFTGSAAFSTLVEANTIQVRLSSKTKGDDCDLDFFALVIPEGSASTGAPTSAPTTKPTSAPTTKPTSAPTTKPTSAPTTVPTTKPTSAPTTKPTTKPTTAPTTKPTTKPTTAPTTKPTTAPAPGGKICPAGQVWSPAPLTTWQWQLTGTIDQSLDVQMYDIDLFDATAALISSLHSKGRVVICYFSTQYENWRPDAASFPAASLGSNLDNWPGERYVDIRSSAVRSILAARLDLAVSKGCDGVEPDNVDSYANSNGFGLTAANQLDFNKFLANEAHARGLSVGLKNDLDQVSALVSYFDWALNEQCNEYGECSMLDPFVNAGKAVFGVEYTGSATNICPNMVTDKFSWLMKSLDLGASGTQCCTYNSGGCANKAAYTCVDRSAKRSIEEETEEVALVEETAQVVEISAPAAENSAASVSVPAVAVFVVASALALVL